MFDRLRACVRACVCARWLMLFGSRAPQDQRRYEVIARERVIVTGRAIRGGGAKPPHQSGGGWGGAEAVLDQLMAA